MKLKTYFLTGFFALCSILWLHHVFFVLPTSLSFLNYAGIEKTSLGLLLGVGFLPVFFVLMVMNVIEKSLQKESFFSFFHSQMRIQRSLLESSDATTKSMIEMLKIGYTTQFFSMLPVIYEDFYDSLRRILRGSFVMDAPRIDSKTDDIWSLCRAFLIAVARDPALMEDIRRNFKKHDEMAKEFMNFKFRYDRLIKALKTYDRDQFVYQFIEEGSLGRVCGLLTKIYDRAFEEKPTPPSFKPETERTDFLTSNTEDSLLAGLSIEVKK